MVDIQIFGMNMTFIFWSEVKNIYFMIGEARNEIYNFSLHIHSKNLNFLFIIYNNFEALLI